MYDTINYVRSIETWIEVVSTAFIVIAWLFQFNKKNKSINYLLIWILMDFMLNRLMDFVDGRHQNYNFLFYISYFLDFLLTGLFFNYCVPVFKKIRIGIYLAVIGFVFWLFNMLFFEPMAFDITTSHSYFYYVAFYDFCIVMLSIVAMYFMFINNDWAVIRNNILFWLLFILMIRYGIDFVYGITIPLVKTIPTYFYLSLFLEWLPGDLSVAAIGVVFLVYRKKQQPIE